jgi:hypothetical protein
LSNFWIARDDAGVLSEFGDGLDTGTAVERNDESDSRAQSQGLLGKSTNWAQSNDKAKSKHIWGWGQQRRLSRVCRIESIIFSVGSKGGQRLQTGRTQDCASWNAQDFHEKQERQAERLPYNSNIACGAPKAFASRSIHLFVCIRVNSWLKYWSSND